ncbi:MAG: cation diffusion facilitator family transporter [Ilumatobacteraceae bacterium]
MNEGSRKAVVAAFVANLGIAVAKFVGFLLTRSAGLLAESVHSLADTGNQGLLMLGGRRSRRKKDERHPFGHGRERYFWSFIVALVLFSMGGLFALYEGIHKITDPHETENLPIAIGILLVAIGLESYSLRTAVEEARRVRKSGESLFAFIRSARQPELPVVLLEDNGAEAGLFLALAGVLTAHWTHDPRWDAVGSISIGVLLVVIAIVLAVEMKSLLIGESALLSENEEIRKAVESHPSVVSIIHLRTQHLGPEEILVATKIEFDPALDVAGLASAIDEVEALVRAALATAKYIFIEPDVRHDDARPPLDH